MRISSLNYVLAFIVLMAVLVDARMAGSAPSGGVPHAAGTSALSCCGAVRAAVKPQSGTRKPATAGCADVSGYTNVGCVTITGFPAQVAAGQRITFSVSITSANCGVTTLGANFGWPRLSCSWVQSGSVVVDGVAGLQDQSSYFYPFVPCTAGNPPRLDPDGTPIGIDLSEGTHTISLTISPSAPSDCVQLQSQGANCEPLAVGPWIGVMDDGFDGNGNQLTPCDEFPFQVSNNPQVSLAIQTSHDQSFPEEANSEVEPGQTVEYTVTATTLPATATGLKIELKATFPDAVVDHFLRVSAGGKADGANSISWTLSGTKRTATFSVELKAEDKLPDAGSTRGTTDLIMNATAIVSVPGKGSGNGSASSDLNLLYGATVHPIAYEAQSESLSVGGWDLDVQVSANSGVEFSNIRRVIRIVLPGGKPSSLPVVVSPDMTIPYFMLQTSTTPEQRFELQPDGGLSPGRGRLIDFVPKKSTRGGIDISATYAIDEISDSSKSVLLITQHYVFEPATDAPPLFQPAVSYTFLGDSGETLDHVQIAQRFVWGPTLNQAALFNGTTATDPVPVERTDTVINQGVLGAFSEYKQHTSDGTTDVDNPWIFPSSGALHIPAGSNQTVNTALNVTRAADAHPTSYLDLIQGGNLNGAEATFWWVSTGFQPSDQFFIQPATFNYKQASL